jgi:protein gp37
LEDLGTFDLSGISWVIVGGESGPGARPILKEWVISIREQCKSAGVPFFFKQWGGTRKSLRGRKLEGKTYSEYPDRISAPVPEKAECLTLARSLVRATSGLLQISRLAPAS